MALNVIHSVLVRINNITTNKSLFECLVKDIPFVLSSLLEMIS